MRSLVILLAFTLLVACGPSAVTKHDLDWTKGQVHFSTHRKGFYKMRWFKQVKASQPRICAGFVHKENFSRYLKYGKFELEMTLEVFKGGQPRIEGGRVVDWTGGTLLRTLRKRRPIRASNNGYVWCGRLQKGGTWKQGAMRFTYELKGPERAMDEFMAKGILQITP